MTELSNQQQLKIQKGILQAEDDLVTWIENALDTTEYGDLEESQFRNLVRFADTHDNPKPIQNFLRYLMSKDNKWGKGEESLATRIIADIGIEGQGGKLIDLANKIAQSVEYCDIKSIWIELIRRYLGYGSRYLKYLRDQ